MPEPTDVLDLRAENVTDAVWDDLVASMTQDEFDAATMRSGHGRCCSSCGGGGGCSSCCVHQA